MNSIQQIFFKFTIGHPLSEKIVIIGVYVTELRPFLFLFCQLVSRYITIAVFIKSSQLDQ